MGKVLIAIIFLVIGLAIGIFGGGLLIGASTGVGIATGVSAGICSTVQAAEQEGLLTPDQVDQVLNRAAANVAELAGSEAPAEMVGSAAECDAVLERLRSAAAN